MPAHHHGHAHAPHLAGPKNYTRAFVIGTLLNVSFVAIEVGFGLVTASLSLLADAAHNLSDVMGLLLAWGASVLAQRPPSRRYTYGLRRSSILAALVNGIALLLAMGGIAWESLRRLGEPQTVDGTLLIWVAGVGVVINSLTAVLFMAGRERDLNIKGAFLHMAADALVSLGVVLAGVAILTTGWGWVDPAVSLVIVMVVVAGTWQLLKDSLNLALDGVPSQIEPAAVKTFLGEQVGVSGIHDLHIWAVSTTETALTAHLVMPTGHPGDRFLAELVAELRHHFNIAHATLQIEVNDTDHPCLFEPDHTL